MQRHIGDNVRPAEGEMSRLLQTTMAAFNLKRYIITVKVERHFTSCDDWLGDRVYHVWSLSYGYQRRHQDAKIVLLQKQFPW